MKEISKKEKMMQEAVKRMEALHIISNAISEFKKGIINKSEYGGFLYWLNDKEKELVKKFQEDTGAIVYACILNHMEFGDCLSLLYVSPHEEEWEYDREDLKDQCPFVYVHNFNAPELSEYGHIGICPRFGGLARTA